MKVFLFIPFKKRLFYGTMCKNMLVCFYVLTNGACRNRRVARAERLILGGVAGVFGGNGVVFLKD